MMRLAFLFLAAAADDFRNFPNRAGKRLAQTDSVFFFQTQAEFVLLRFIKRYVCKPRLSRNGDECSFLTRTDFGNIAYDGFCYAIHIDPFRVSSPICIPAVFIAPVHASDS